MGKFEGFKPADFAGLKGTTWRGKDALGGELAGLLRKELGNDCRSWGVRRRAELHIARDSAYDFNDPFPRPKLFVYTLNDERDELAFGYYVEGGNRKGKPPVSFHAVEAFQDAMGGSTEVLKSAAAIRELYVADYYNESNSKGALGWTFKIAPNRIEMTNRADSTSLASLQNVVGAIRGLGRSPYVDLHIFSRIPAKEAIAMRERVVGAIVETLVALAPLYRATIK